MARPTLFRALPALALTAALCSSLPAKPGRVVTKDGKTYEGDVTENVQDKTVEVNSANGTKYKFSAQNLAHPIEYDDSIPVPVKPAPATAAQPQPGQPGPAMTVEQEYEKRHSVLAANDVEGRIRLSRWALGRQQYDLAHDAAQEVLDIDKRNADAQELIRTIDAQRKLDRKTGTGATGQPTSPARATGPASGAAGTGAAAHGGDANANATQPGGKEKGGNGLVPPLSPDEINRVRLLEWHGERNVRVRLQNDVKHRYLSHSGVKPAEFNKMDAVDEALLIKKHGTPDMWNDIRIASDPPALQEYRSLIQRALLNGCATAACHGGGAGSERFALHTKADHEPEAYANFITLNKFHYKPAKGREAEMIDRNRPEDSLLVQFGLPFDLANTPHPDVEGYRPVFRTKNDPKLRQVVHWIADSLSPLQSDYGVPFDAQHDHGKADKGAEPAGGADVPRPDDTKAPPAGAPQRGGAGSR